MIAARMVRWLPLALLVAAARPAMAAYSAWLKVDPIPGEALDPAHKDWIDVAGFEVAGILREVGGFSLRKGVDRATPKLLHACAQGTVFPKVTVDFRRFVSGAPQAEYLRLELENVVFTGQSVAAITDAGRPDETVSLAFEKVVYIYHDGTGKSGAFHYDNTAQTGGEGTGAPGGGEDPDSDGDGMPDAWEIAHGLADGVNDAHLDADGDGFTNLQEYQLGTDPRSGASFFKATLVPHAVSPGTHQLTWNSVGGKTYVIEWSADLVTPFAPVRTVTAAGATTTENVSQPGTLGFYRVRPAP